MLKNIFEVKDLINVRVILYGKVKEKFVRIIYVKKM